MNELKDIYDFLIDTYNQKRKDALKVAIECKWLSSSVKKEIADILSEDSEKVQKFFKDFKGYFFGTAKGVAKDVVELIRLKGTVMLITAGGGGLNDYVKTLFLWAAINKSWAEFCWSFDKKVSVEAFLVSISYLTQLYSVEHYRELLKIEREYRLKRISSSKKGGNVVAELAALFRNEAIRLLHRAKSDGKEWKSKKKAVEAIENELWQFIETKRKEGHKTLLKQESLNDAVLRWATCHDDLRFALENVVKNKKTRRD
ncbi:TPA: hypothetical protein ACS7XE_001803 [Providencia alcalifaciens]|uniref:hypothetical protein n=1 Tax=Providencia sp. PROV039 TaxID=2949770 RepID=UPI0023495830|nr:hypothetical protein [Providencia sp. PROV039]